MPRKQVVAILCLGAMVVLAVVGSSTLLRPPEAVRAPVRSAPTRPERQGELAALREEIAELERQLLAARAQPPSASNAREEPPAGPPTVDEILNRARGLSNSKRNAPERLRLFREVLDRSGHPDDRAQAFYNIAMTHAVLGQLTDKVYYLELAVQTGASHPIRTSAAYSLALHLRRHGDLKEALALIEEFLADTRHHKSLVANAGACRAEWLAKLGEKDRAKEAAEEFLRNNEGSVDRWNASAVKRARGLLAGLERR